MSAKETLEGPKTDKKKSRKKSRMQVRVYAGHGFSTSGLEGVRRAKDGRGERKLRLEGQISNGGPSYIGLYQQRAGLGPIRYGLCGGIMQLREPDQPNTPFQPGQKGQITARSGAKVGPIGRIVLH